MKKGGKKKKKRKKKHVREGKKRAHSWLHGGTTGVPHIAGMKRAGVVLMLLDSWCRDPAKNTVQNAKMLQGQSARRLNTAL